MSVRDQLLAACENGDHVAIHRLGWGDVWEVLATGWAPRQTCSMNELKHWAKMLGNEDPAGLLPAIDECAGVWRPTPGQIRGHLNAKRADTSSVDVGRGRDRSSALEAVQAVAEALRAGEQACACGRMPVPDANGSLRFPRWRRDAEWVLRCSACGGLEQGQLYAAEDAGLLGEEAA